MRLIIKYKYTLVGILIGAIAGYLYYYFVGCSSGTCLITSKPLNSTAYGGLLGALLFSGLKNQNTENEKQ